MSYKSIVTFILDAQADNDVLLAAAAMAEANDGHLTAVCLGIDRSQPGAYYAGTNIVALQQSLAIAQDEAKATEDRVREILSPWNMPWEVLRLTTQMGVLNTVVADFAQLADLVILPKPYGEGRGIEDVAVVEAALFKTRAPVLVLPEGVNSNITPKQVVVAWNQSVEALAAIRAAMPLLQRATLVNIAVIDPPSHGPDRSDPGGALAEMLARHGVKVDVSVIARTMPRISDVLARHAEDRDADMIVMGAYGHSRLREAILGGATRNTLEQATLPVLMAH